MNEVVESVIIEVLLNTESCRRKAVICEIYRPPGKPIFKFLESLQLLLEQISREGLTAYITGDININLLKCLNDQGSVDLINLFLSYAYIPLVNRPTRTCVRSISFIDVIFTNDIMNAGNSVTNILITCFNPEHFLIVHCINDSQQPGSMVSTHGFLFINPRTIEKYQQSFINSDWSSVLDANHLNYAFERFYNRILAASSPTLPRLFERQSIQSEDWITSDLHADIKVKNKLARKYNRNPNDYNKAAFKKFRNRLN